MSLCKSTKSFHIWMECWRWWWCTLYARIIYCTMLCCMTLTMVYDDGDNEHGYGMPNNDDVVNEIIVYPSRVCNCMSVINNGIILIFRCFGGVHMICIEPSIGCLAYICMVVCDGLMNAWHVCTLYTSCIARKQDIFTYEIRWFPVSTTSASCAGMGTNSMWLCVGWRFSDSILSRHTTC